MPKVFYLGADESVIRPESATRPFIYKEGQVLLRPLGSPAPDPRRPGAPRVDYDTPHVKPWGLDMALYLLTKGIATGTMLVSLLLPFASGDRATLTTVVGPAISLVFLLVTTVLLVADLERPERFFYILVRPNWRSWLVWGAYFLTAQGLLTTLWLGAAVVGPPSLLAWLFWPLVIVSLLTTCYTGFLFKQGLARDLWQGPQSTVDLLAQAIVEGCCSAAPRIARAGRDSRPGRRGHACGHAGRRDAGASGPRRVRVSRDAESHATPPARRSRHPPRLIRETVLGRRHRHRCHVGHRRGPVDAGCRLRSRSRPVSHLPAVLPGNTSGSKRARAFRSLESEDVRI